MTNCTPFDTSQYQYVRFVGTITSTGDNFSCGFSNNYNGTTTIVGNKVTTAWFRRLTDTGDEYVYLGGLFYKYGPQVSYTWSTADDAMDSSNIDYSFDVAPHIVNYQPYQTESGADHKWRANYKLQVNDLDTAALAYYQLPFGDIGGSGYSLKDNGTPNPALITAYFSIFPSSDTSQQTTGVGICEINGHWEFSNDEVTVEATWLGFNDEGEDLECLPEPIGCTPFDPSQYQYVRYVGKGTATGLDPIHDISDPFYGSYIDSEGNIETPWTILEEDDHRYVGTLWNYQLVMGGGAPRLYDASVNVTNGYHEFDFGGLRKTSWTPAVNFYDHVDQDIPGGPQIGTGQGVPWRANVTVTTNGLQGGYGSNVAAIGDLGSKELGLANPLGTLGSTPLFAVRSFASLHNTGTDSGLYPEVDDSITLTIEGNWEFSNDQVTVEATWLGTNDAGEDLECLPEPTPEPSSCTLFDPTAYTHVRFKGTATVTDYVDWSNYPDQEPGTYSVQSNWKYMGYPEGHAQHFDALFVGSAAGANPNRNGYQSELTSFLCSSPYTDSEGTTTWTSSYTNDNLTVTPCGNGQGKPWLTKVSVSTTGYEAPGSNAIPRIHLGELGKIRYSNGLNNVVDFPFPYPANMGFPEFFAVVWTNRTNRDEVGSASIDGVWEFSNDGGQTIAATWKGLNDKGQDIDYLECTGYDSTSCPVLSYNPVWLSNPCPRLKPPIGPELTCPELPGPPVDLDPPIDIPDPESNPDNCTEIVNGYGNPYRKLPGEDWVRTSANYDPTFWKLEVHPDDEVNIFFNKSQYTRKMLGWTYSSDTGYAQEPGIYNVYTGVPRAGTMEEARQAIFKLVPIEGTCKT